MRHIQPPKLAYVFSAMMMLLIAPGLGAQTIQNSSFETPVVGPTGRSGSYQFNPSGAVWTFYGEAGIAAKGSQFAPMPFSTNGSQIAFLEGVGGVGGNISQTISNFPAGLFTIISSRSRRLVGTIKARR